MATQTLTFAAGASITVAFRAAMAAAGYEVVEQDVPWSPLTAGYTSYPVTGDIWKSPGTLNKAGVDHYIIIGEMNFAGNRYCWIFGAEGYDPATNQVTGYAPYNPASITPSGDFTAATPAALGAMAQITALGGWNFTSGGGSIKIDITVDRLLTNTFFVGLPSRTLPTTLEPRWPLIGVSLTGGDVNPSASYGWATREPGQTVAAATNFRCMVSNSKTYGSLFGFGPGAGTTERAEAHTGQWIASPLYVLSGRWGYTGHRAYLDEVLLLNRNNILSVGDTVTLTAPDGTTSNWVANSFGLCLPAGLF